MSKARPVFPGAVVFSTRRTHKRQLLLRPSKRVNQIMLYIIAVLVERHGVKLHALCAPSNHMHDVATDPSGRIVEFQRDCHSLIARHLNAIHGDFESLWSRTPTCRVTCLRASDVLDKIVYTMVNPVEALLVARGESWPGIRLAWPHRPIVIRRPKGFFRDEEEGGTWPEEVTLRFHRPPGFEELSDEELAGKIRQQIERKEKEIRDWAAARGKRFLGRRAVLRQSRYAYPRSGEERFRMRPAIASRSPWARVERIRFERAWREDYEESKRRFCAGERDVVFPYGTYKLRVYYGVTCRPPPTTAAPLGLLV